MDEKSSSEARNPLEKASAYHYRETISPEEYEALMELGAAMASPTCETQCFVLGSYNPGEKRKLEYVRNDVNDWPGI